MARGRPSAKPARPPTTDHPPSPAPGPAAVTTPPPATVPRRGRARGARDAALAWLARGTPLAPNRLASAIAARRSASLALALALFAVGFTLDDLRTLRTPGYLLGSAAAVATLALGPLWMGRRLAADHPDEPDDAFEARAQRQRRIGALVLLVTALAFLAWLAAFSSGVPPWAA